MTFKPSSDLPLTLTLTLTLISSLQLKKVVWWVGGWWWWWWINPLQTLSQGLVLTLRFSIGPELDNFIGMKIDECNSQENKIHCDCESLYENFKGE